MSPQTQKAVEITLKILSAIAAPFGVWAVNPTGGLTLASASVLGVIAGLQTASAAFSTAPKDVQS